MPVIFDGPLLCPVVKSCISMQLCCEYFHWCSGLRCFQLYDMAPESVGCNSDVEPLFSHFNLTFYRILAEVALLKTRSSKTRPKSWINDRTRAVRRECRRTEYRWKKDILQMPFQMLRNSWCLYQRTVKTPQIRCRLLFLTITILVFYSKKQ